MRRLLLSVEERLKIIKHANDKIMKKWINFINENKNSAAGIVICINDDEKFLILRRSDIDQRGGEWTLPGGHIDDEDNSIEHGAARELKEETGLNCQVSDLIYLGEPKPEKYYYFAKEWSGSVDVLIPNPKTGEIEHDAYRWATIEQVKELGDTNIPIYLLEKALESNKV